MLILVFCVELYPIRIEHTKLDVVGISCPNIPGALAKVLGYLSEEGVFIEYMYSFANNHIANVVIRPSNLDKCIEVLKEKKVDLLAASDLYKL